jgi:hypothetical protein
MRALLFLSLPVLCTSLLACGGAAEPQPSQPPLPGPRLGGQTGEAPILFGAQQGGQLLVVGVRADTGTAVPFGPALPADSSTQSIQNLYVSADGGHVVAVVAPVVGAPNWTSESTTVFLGDGTAWKTLDQGVSVGVQSVSDDFSLVVTSHPCQANGGAESTVSVLRSDGSHAYDGGTCALGDRAPFVYSLAPNGSYFVLQMSDGSLDLVTAAGSKTLLAAANQEAIPGQLFATSLLVGSGPRPAWFDTSAQPIDVPGWASAIATPSGLQVMNGGLYALQDRGMRRVADLAPSVDPTTVVGYRGDLVLSRATGAVTTNVLDANGAVVASYTPAPPKSSPHDPSLMQMMSAGSSAVSETTSDGWAVFEDIYQTPNPIGDGGDVYERADDLWLFLDKAGQVQSKVVTLRRAAIPAGGSSTAWPTREYVSSSSGAYVLYTDSGVVHTHAVDTDAEQAISSPFVFVATNTFRSVDPSAPPGP